MFKKYTLDGVLLVLMLLAPLKPVLLSIGILILTDLATGMYAAFKNKEPITSFKLRQTPTKMATYLIAIICAFLVEQYILGGGVPIVKVVSGMISSTELLSVYENLNKISGIDLTSKVRDLLQPPKA